jgi:hypothetical protein
MTAGVELAVVFSQHLSPAAPKLVFDPDSAAAAGENGESRPGAVPAGRLSRLSGDDGSLEGDVGWLELHLSAPFPPSAPPPAAALAAAQSRCGRVRPKKQRGDDRPVGLVVLH